MSNAPGRFSTITHLLDLPSDYVTEKYKPLTESLPGRPPSLIRDILKEQAEAYGKLAVRCVEWGYPDAARVWAIWAAQAANELVELEANSHAKS